MRSLGVRAARGAGVQIAADDLLLPLDHLHPQRVALAGRGGLGRHAEVHGGEQSAGVGDCQFLDGLARDADAARHLLRLSAVLAGRGDLALLDVVDRCDFLSDPARRSCLNVADGGLHSFAALLVDLCDGVHELLEVFDLHGDGCLCRCCHLLNMQKETGGRLFARRPLAVGFCLVFFWSAARNCHGVARASCGLLQDIE